MVLIFISPLASGIEYLFMCSFAIYVSFLVTYQPIFLQIFLTAHAYFFPSQTPVSQLFYL